MRPYKKITFSIKISRNPKETEKPDLVGKTCSVLSEVAMTYGMLAFC